MMKNLSETFREESLEILAELEDALLELEENPDDSEVVDRVFRALHTIKGSGAMSGFDAVAEFTHEIETVFELVREGRVRVTKELVNLTLSSKDQIKAMIESSFGGTDAELEDSEALIRAIRRFIPAEDEETSAVLASSDESVDEASQKKTFQIYFKPAQEIFLKGINPHVFFRELRQLGECHISVCTDAIPPLEEMNAEYCYLGWEILLTTERGIDAIKDVFIFVEDECELRIEELEGGSCSVKAEAAAGGGSNSLRSGKSGKDGVGGNGSTASVRVRSDKLDLLVDLIGELVTVQARLTQATADRNDPELDSISEEVDRLTWALRDQVLNIRMLPIGTTFSQFRRLVRDLSHELGKDVELTTEGAETELDKTVIERLHDPLVHLIRNCIDHGIESPDDRLAAGKGKRGRVQLSATHAGANVLIKVRDDGAGLDRERVREKAIGMGLITRDTEVTEKELLALIFHPGFSTAGTVSNVSGRGVGMDVVKRAVESLRGSIDVTTKSGEGTTFTVTLPLTLAIIDGLLVTIDGDFFVLPLSVIEECVELKRSDTVNTNGRNIAHVRGEIIPYVRLRDQFAIATQAPEIEQVIIANLEGQRVGFVADHVVGKHQTVIKSLGRMYRDIKGLSGATILGDGTVALILDLPQLVEEASIKELEALEDIE